MDFLEGEKVVFAAVTLIMRSPTWYETNNLQSFGMKEHIAHAVVVHLVVWNSIHQTKNEIETLRGVGEGRGIE